MRTTNDESDVGYVLTGGQMTSDQLLPCRRSQPARYKQLHLDRRTSVYIFSVEKTGAVRENEMCKKTKQVANEEIQNVEFCKEKETDEK